MAMEKPDYTIQIFMSVNPGEHPVFAVVTANRYKDTKQFSGNTPRAVLLKIAEWIKEN